jgi:hypothetical protein
MGPAGRVHWHGAAALALAAVTMTTARAAAQPAAASAVPAVAQQTATAPAPLEGEEAETFLKTARVIAREPIGSGITRSERLGLTDGTRTARAAWKTIHQHIIGTERFQGGRTEFDFRDSWKHDVAAYELDKLLGLRLVPVTIERRIDGKTGALQMWIEGAFTEVDRRNRKLQPPNAAIWMHRRAAESLLRELVHDTDYNIHNTLYDPSFRLYAIDFSRGFRVQPQLQDPDRIECFSRSVLEHLRALDRPTLEARLGPWLDRIQITGLLARRDRILALADRRVATRGEGATLVP